MRLGRRAAQVLRGALVAGPAGPGDDTYYDERDDYVTNEVGGDVGMVRELGGVGMVVVAACCCW